MENYRNDQKGYELVKCLFFFFLELLDRQWWMLMVGAVKYNQWKHRSCTIVVYHIQVAKEHCIRFKRR